MDALEETCDNLPGDYADRCKGEYLAKVVWPVLLLSNYLFL